MQPKLHLVTVCTAFDIYIYIYISFRDVTRSCGTKSCEIRLVSRERDDILAKYFAMFTLELHN